jgi:hypothetical protein
MQLGKHPVAGVIFYILNYNMTQNFFCFQRQGIKSTKYYNSLQYKQIQSSNFSPLNTKRRPLYLKTQFVPRSKHFSSRL